MKQIAAKGPAGPQEQQGDGVPRALYPALWRYKKVAGDRTRKSRWKYKSMSRGLGAPPSREMERLSEVSLSKGVTYLCLGCSEFSD